MNTQYEWIQGQPVQTDNTNFEWVLGSPYILYEHIVVVGDGTNMKINIGDVWKDVDSIKINIGDVWKDVVEVKQNIGDSWKTVF